MQSNRRQFLGSTTIGIFGMIPIARNFDFSKPKILGFDHLEDSEIDPSFPTTSAADASAVVGASHTRFEVVQELVNARPELAKASYDWGFGDWESALGAASHMGRKDIAEFLMEHGARADIFTFAMLGKLEAVKSIIESVSGIEKIWGPHGFTLMHHAEIRLKRKNVEGDEKVRQEELVDYLTQLGTANTKAESQDITTEEQNVFVGRYNFGENENDNFDVTINSQGNLFVARGTSTGRSLLKIAENTFAPGGAPSVRIVFEVHDGIAKSITVHDPIPIVKAVRV